MYIPCCAVVLGYYSLPTVTRIEMHGAKSSQRGLGRSFYQSHLCLYKKKPFFHDSGLLTHRVSIFFCL